VEVAARNLRPHVTANGLLSDHGGSERESAS
jgi:hypothetical protein